MEKDSTKLKKFFEEADKFITNIDPRKATPPFISTSLRIKRKEDFKYISSIENEVLKQEALELFIKKYENDYLEDLRIKLKERYIDTILQKRYDLPSDLNVKEIKHLGALTELNTLAIAVAEWSIELEILAYTIEGLVLYGFQPVQGTINTDIVSHLKNEYTFKSVRTMKSVSSYLVQKMISLSLKKFSSLAIAKGVSKIQLGGSAIWEIALAFSMTSRVPWNLVIKYLNVPWLIGGFISSYLIKQIGEYVEKDEVVTNMQKMMNGFEENKLNIMDQRKVLYEEIIRKVKSQDKRVHEECQKKVKHIIENLMEPNTIEGNTINGDLNPDFEKSFNIKELEDCVLIEDKEFKEVEDEDSGFLVIE